MLELEDILSSDIIVFIGGAIRKGYNFHNYDYHEALDLEGARNYTQLYIRHRVLANNMRDAIDDSEVTERSTRSVDWESQSFVSVLV